MPLSLAWSAPPECPPGHAVSHAVERLVTKAPAQALEASVRVERRGERFAAEIRTSSGKRNLEGESCRAVAEAAAMVLALAIDPEARSTASAFAAFDEPPAGHEPEPEAPASGEREPAAAPKAGEASSLPERDVPAPRPAEPSAEGAPSWSLSLLGLGELGMLPQATLGGTVGVGVLAAPWSAEIGALLLAPRSGTLQDDPSRGGELAYIGGYAAGCLQPIATRRLDACISFEAGRLGGAGFGVTNSTPNAALWIAPGVLGALHVPVVSGVHGEIRLGAALALQRPRFGLDDLGHVHQPALVTLRGQAGVSFR